MLVGVSGATGFVGRQVVELLLSRGHRVRALCRKLPATATLPPGVDVHVVGAICGDTDWRDSLRELDVIVHLAARVHVLDDRSLAPLKAYREVNVDGTVRLARASAAAGVRRFVFVSSIKVNGETTTGTPFSESSPPNPLDPYGISKWEGEQALFEVAEETGLEVVILRPPLVYGPGVKANFRRLIAAVDRGVPLPLGAVRNRRSLVYVGNLADVIVRAVEHPRAAGETFLVSDGPAISSGDLVREIGRALDRSPRLLPIPPALISLGGRVLRREAMVQRLLSSLEIDSSRIRERLEWTPPYTLRQGLAETAAWWRGEGRA